MTSDIYSPPQADLGIESTTQDEFYVVAPKKFLILYLATMGMYGIYWFYKNWQNYKIKHSDDIWPIPRAIFAIFFVHGLFESIAARVKDKNPDLNWASTSWAVLYILLTLGGTISNQLAGRDIGVPFTHLVALLTFPIMAYITYKAQHYINIACDDPKGLSNNNITAANIIWIIIGLIWTVISLLYVVAVVYSSR